jgi:hypothetical protein
MESALQCCRGLVQLLCASTVDVDCNHSPRLQEHDAMQLCTVQQVLQPARTFWPMADGMSASSKPMILLTIRAVFEYFKLAKLASY